MKNLAHSASLDSEDKDAPSKSGIKQGLHRPDVVAHDFGGSNALRGHLLNGLEYRSLVLIDPVAISPQGSPLVQAAKGHEEVFAALPA
jgi:pimeloyl-ACP methyl ester carboxylesterase